MMMKTRNTLLFLTIAMIIVSSCAEKSDPSFDQKDFTSVFDNNRFSSAVYPIDIKQTPDGGYIILAERKLSESNFRGIYLMKADQYGKFISEVVIDDNFVNPVGPILVLG